MRSQHSIKQIHQLLQNGKIMASELCEGALRRAEEIKPLNTFINITKNEARVHAQHASRRFKEGTSKGLLDGVPIAVKDNFCTKDVETTCGSRMLKSFTPKYNATVVQKLLDQGGVLIGKCNMDEFAMGCGTVDSLYGPTKNIWQSQFDPKFRAGPKNNKEGTDSDWYIAGGSSGGSAIAVASGAVFAALGSDTGGSTRNPAAYCGIVGLKPTFGLVSRHGLIPLVNSMDVPGILTRTVEDSAVMLSILAGHDPRDSTTINTATRNQNYLNGECNIKDVCVGIPVEYHPAGLSKEVLKAWDIVASKLDDAGAKVVQVSMPHTPASVACYAVLNQCEVASNMARYDGIEFGTRTLESTSTEELFASSRREGFGEVVRSRILAGNYFLLRRHYSQYFVQALKLRRLIANDFKSVWESGVDLLLTPTTLTSAPRYKDFISLENQQQCSVQDYCTQPVNLAGSPAISLPVLLSADGTPISVQLITKMWNECTLLSAARWIESVVEFPQIYSTKN